MPTFVAMSSRNKWVAISTNGLLSGNRESEAISAVPLEARPAEDEGVHAFVVPQERPDVVLVDVHLRDVLRRDLRLPAPAAGREQEAGEGVPGDGDVLRDLFPEPLVEDAEVAHGDVVDVLVVFVRHGLVRGTHPADRVPGPEDRGDVAALSHRVQVADHIAVDVRDRHVRERGHPPSMLNAVRASRTATLNDVHPRYASFPMRPARLSPTRCQNSTTPSAPAFSIMSSIRDARATSITRSLRPWASHERTQDLLESRPPLLLRLRGDC